MISKGHNMKFPICILEYKPQVFLSQQTLPNDSVVVSIGRTISQASNVEDWKCAELYFTCTSGLQMLQSFPL